MATAQTRRPAPVRMLHGTATVEIVNHREWTRPEDIAGDVPGFPGNCWKRITVTSIVEALDRSVTFHVRGGAHSWAPAGNWRNFHEIDDRSVLGWVTCNGGCGGRAYRHRAGEAALCEGCHGRAWSKLASQERA